MPAHDFALDKKWLKPLEEHGSKTDAQARKSMEEYDVSHKTWPPLKIGMRVMAQDPQTKLWDRCGTIVEIGPQSKHWIKLPSGRCLWRYRRFIRPVKEERKENVELPMKSLLKKCGAKAMQAGETRRVTFSPDRHSDV